MSRIILAAAVLGALVSACGGTATPGPATTAPPPSTLAVDIQPGFIANAKAQHFTLTCDPAGGTVSDPAAACAALEADPALLAPATACGVGMPDIGSKAVTGTWRGKPVKISYRGCDGDDARWAQMARALGL